MKLELKHLAPYLPYRLKMIFEGKGGRILEVTGLRMSGISEKTCQELYFSSVNETLHTDYFKPILRPLSDLTKEIEVNGESFCPLICLFELCEGGSYTTDTVFIGENNGIYKISNSISELQFHSMYSYFVVNSMDMEGEDLVKPFNQFELFEKLFEWHFDVFGLIEKGLVIDVNTI